MEKSLYPVHAEMEDKHWWFCARRAIINGFLDIVAGKQERPTIIDIGCGTGATVAALSEYGSAAIGIDTSEITGLIGCEGMLLEIETKEAN